MTDRDTHFAIFAESHYLELSDLFAEMYACQITNDHSGEDEAKHSIQTLIAQRAYDLVEHVLEFYTLGETVYEPQDIPDLTAWPTTEQ